MDNNIMFDWLGKPDLKLVSDEGAVFSTYKVILGTFSASLRHLITDIGMDHSEEPLCLIFQGQSEDDLKEIVQSAKTRFKINIEAQTEDLIIRREENSHRIYKKGMENILHFTIILKHLFMWLSKILAYINRTSCFTFMETLDILCYIPSYGLNNSYILCIL